MPLVFKKAIRWSKSSLVFQRLVVDVVGDRATAAAVVELVASASAAIDALLLVVKLLLLLLLQW